ncbi:DUF423 domain-containing protein [Deinococcus maricopensis]|uniref:DUF423 domain-containing protein n=1 Tax=Deinococcus maricopensis (strain DSM 21211 / LMG 22137 / NRRL B-23946 / LB-34) TaxID=709986 RepID=E8U9I6_DEIML|nr:DUF423 domain-containing protein [Deinococcus maricopensis]ADV67725.1 protein of unknown function DUF423 [Deinococcus maricopensis DSM 21211]
MTTTPNTNAALWGALLAGSGVALGAFGAHALKNTLSTEALATFETGVRYQMYAGLGTLALAALPGQTRAPTLIGAGAVVFSGSLYTLTLTGQKWLGAVTPIGGALMIAGFVLAAVDARRRA